MKKGAQFPKLQAGDILGYDEGRIAMDWEVGLNNIFKSLDSCSNWVEQQVYYIILITLC